MTPPAKRVVPWAGLGLACAACCTVSFILPIAAGLGFTGLAGWFTGKLEVIICAAAAVAIMGLALLIGRRRRAPADTCKANGACGCRPDP